MNDTPSPHPPLTLPLGDTKQRDDDTEMPVTPTCDVGKHYVYARYHRPIPLIKKDGDRIPQNKKNKPELNNI